MNKIYDYDNSHNHFIDFSKLLPSGYSFFTCIKGDFDEIDEVCDFLLQHRVDPNKPDKFGYYPLQKAILINSPKFVLSLINSGKINYSNKLSKGKTYLHYASRKIPDILILTAFIDRNLIDINSQDDKGETPLMEACRENLLFEKDNLDYLHCNKEGLDALRIVELLPKNEYEEAIKSKEKYHQKLISILESSYTII